MYGFLSKSQAMISDAANSAGDIFASVMSSIGSKLLVLLKMSLITLDMEKLNIYFHFFISLSMIIISLKINI